MEKTLVVEESALQAGENREARPVVVPQVGQEGRPDPQWVRGRCPECGDDLVSNLYYVGGKGYLLCWECWSSLGESPTCRYRKVL